MATNFEFYKDEILAISGEEKEIALVSNKPVPCEDIDCTACDFKGECHEYRLIQWLSAEHIEQPKLTKRERAFCEAVQKGWIMSLSGTIYWTNMQPQESENRSSFNPSSCVARLKDLGLGFEWVKEDQIFNVEYLLKLEVQ